MIHKESGCLHAIVFVNQPLLDVFRGGADAFLGELVAKVDACLDVKFEGLA